MLNAGRIVFILTEPCEWRSDSGEVHSVWVFSNYELTSRVLIVWANSRCALPSLKGKRKSLNRQDERKKPTSWVISTLHSPLLIDSLPKSRFFVGSSLGKLVFVRANKRVIDSHCVMRGRKTTQKSFSTREQRERETRAEWLKLIFSPCLSEFFNYSTMGIRNVDLYKLSQLLRLLRTLTSLDYDVTTCAVGTACARARTTQLTLVNHAERLRSACRLHNDRHGSSSRRVNQLPRNTFRALSGLELGRQVRLFVTKSLSLIIHCVVRQICFERSLA